MFNPDAFNTSKSHEDNFTLLGTISSQDAARLSRHIPIMLVIPLYYTYVYKEVINYLFMELISVYNWYNSYVAAV